MSENIRHTYWYGTNRGIIGNINKLTHLWKDAAVSKTQVFAAVTRGSEAAFEV